MITPNVDPSNPEIRFSHKLRDTIFDHLPPQTEESIWGVTVIFHPDIEGDNEMDLKIVFDPNNSVIHMEAIEGIYGPEGKLTGSLVKGCEVDPDTGEVSGYDERMEAEGESGSIMDLLAEEKDAGRFDASKRDFFLKLFDCI